MATLVGQTVSHYKILEHLGGGGMGVVYKAQDTKLDRPVALKFLPPELTRDTEAKERFIYEARAASALDHQNICNVHDIGETDDNQIFIIMAYYEGETLKKRIEREPLKIVEAIDFATQVAQGLTKAHVRGIVHRDIKPANVMITNDGVAKIVDFGLAKLIGQARLTRTQSAVGTVAYMSPEQVQGLDTDQRSDIWSLGVTLYEMLTGRLPFKGEFESSLIYSILNSDPEPIATLRPDVPPQLQRVIEGALQKDPFNRQQSCGQLCLELALIKDLRASALLVTAQSVRSIAVLPFLNMSADAENEYFSDGLSEDIIHLLTRVKDFRVVARTSAFSFKGKATDIRDIGRKLGVATVLEGSVRKTGNRLRITAQLINAEDGYHLWSEQYDRVMDDVFAIQDEITRTIVMKVREIAAIVEWQEGELPGGEKADLERAARSSEARDLREAGSPSGTLKKFRTMVEKLRGELPGGEKDALVKRPTHKHKAYEIYLKGRYCLNKRTEEMMRRAITLFEQALQEDPDYAAAHAGLADSYNLMGAGDYGVMPPSEAFPKAKAAAERALELDDALAEAHTALGWARTEFDWDWKGGRSSYLRAIELNPGYVTAHHWYAILLSVLGKHDEAREEIGKAAALDPLSLITNSDVAWVLNRSREYDLAIAQCQKTLAIEPAFSVAHWNLGQSYQLKGLYEEAIAELSTAVRLSGSNPVFLASLGQSYGLSGRTHEAFEILEQLHQLSTTRYIMPHLPAMVFVGLGDKDKALDWLEKDYSDRTDFLPEAKENPTLDSLRTDPRFEALLARVGFES